MRKNKFLVCLVLLVAMLLPMLSACGFGGGDTLEIESINAEVLDDGSTMITITYFDDIEEPVVFTIPKGVQGDQGEQGVQGETGNGIQKIDISNKVNGEQTLSIYFTDPDYPVKEVKVKDGTTIDTVERREDEEGNAVLYIKYNDGTEDYFSLPKGDKGDMGEPGVSVINVNYSIDPTTNVTSVSFLLSTGAEIGPILINPGQNGKDGMNLTNDLIQNVVYKTDGDGNQIIGMDGKPIAIGVDIQFVLADGSVTGKVFLPYGQNGADGVGIASIRKEFEVDESGNVLKTIFYFVKTDNTELGPLEVINGIGIKDVKHTLDPDTGDTMVHLYLTDGSIKAFRIPAALSIADITREEDPLTGDVTLTIHYTDDSKPPLVVSLQGARGILKIESSETENQYILTITYTDGSTKTVDFSKNSAWYNGKGDPTAQYPPKPVAGDYYFDQFNRSIWFYEPNPDTSDPLDGSWVEIVDFHSFNQDVKIRFELDKSLGEDWDESNTLLLNRDYYETTLKVGQSFASNQKPLPIPCREGYEFIGWYSTPAPNPAIHGAFTDMTVAPNTTSLTLHAAWRALS